ncbi:MAG: hypothetical protein JWQ14_1475 [Adhaeribacter sp.]|nr:hypothetical protein [Adhaeribacter sp.]
MTAPKTFCRIFGTINSFVLAENIISFAGCNLATQVLIMQVAN